MILCQLSAAIDLAVEGSLATRGWPAERHSAVPVLEGCRCYLSEPPGGARCQVLSELTFKRRVTVAWTLKYDSEYHSVRKRLDATVLTRTSQWRAACHTALRVIEGSLVVR